MTAEPLALGEERIPPDEEELIEELVQIGKKSMEHNDPNRLKLRDQHPKSHGCIKGQFIVEAGIPHEMKVGIFKEPKTYDAWIRFSNSSNSRDDNGKTQPDGNPDGRGMAIKLIDVEGKKVLDDRERQGEQDFIFINSPTFFISDLKEYIDFFTVASAIAAAKKGLKPLPQDPEFQAKFQALQPAFERRAKIAVNINSPLEITYWSSTPYKLGDGRAMKFSAVPNFTGESFKPETAVDKDNYLREAMSEQLATQDITFDFKIQLQTDPYKMPIEDPTVEWNEQESSFIKVATILLPKKDDFNTKERRDFDEQLPFSPWHTLPELQPLGGVNRSRKRLYSELAQLRKQKD